MIKSLIKSLSAPEPRSHKGQNGKLFMVAGSAQYHGAAVLAVRAARRFVDLIYFYPAGQDEYLIHAVKQTPEVIVEYNLERLPECDAVLFGNGIAEVRVPMDIILAKSKKLVVDAEGLRWIKNQIPAGAVLTPHEGEFTRLFGCPGSKENVVRMAKKHRCVILKKSAPDIVSDGHRTFVNDNGNPGMTKGGTGDVLAGLAAALACRNDAFTAAACAAYINGYAGDMLKKRFGYNFCAGDLAEQLGEAYFRLKRS